MRPVGMRTAGSSATLGGRTAGWTAASRDRLPDSAAVLERHAIFECPGFEEFRHELANPNLGRG
jgi:hypothetical protein